MLPGQLNNPARLLAKNKYQNVPKKKSRQKVSILIKNT